MNHCIAQLNIARMRASLEDPVMAGFVAALDPINSLAEQSPGFIWRFQDDDGDATAIRVFDDASILVNLSVWRDVESLKAFVYGDQHIAIVRQKKSWFAKHDSPNLVLWWVPRGHLPTAEEAVSRIKLLADLGPTAEAFNFSRAYPPPEN